MRKQEKRARLRSNLKASRKACCHEGAQFVRHLGFVIDSSFDIRGFVVSSLYLLVTF